MAESTDTFQQARRRAARAGEARMKKSGMEWTPEQESEWKKAEKSVGMQSTDDHPEPELGAEDLQGRLEQEGVPPEEIVKVFDVLSSAPGGIDIAGLKAAAARMAAVVGRAQGAAAAEEMLSKTDLKGVVGDGEETVATGEAEPTGLQEDEEKPKKEKEEKPKKEKEGMFIDQLGSKAGVEGEKDKLELEETNENWFKASKDQLLFERLVDKWIK
jgi:hypothetical protein